MSNFTEPEWLSCLTAGPSVQEAGALTASFYLRPELELFKGHFPTHPLLPAFVQVDMAAWLITKASPDAKVSAIGTAKFVSEVLPGSTVRVECLPLGPQEWDCQVSASTSDGAEQTAAKFRLSLA